jgi:hypothetical protein
VSFHCYVLHPSGARTRTHVADADPEKGIAVSGFGTFIKNGDRWEWVVDSRYTLDEVPRACR